ncbi:MAG TPA: restriction endonuclease subunit R, partial [Candidatus Paceibacterota bacterium]|nr:restriction endonuclease subunit R [Candidatus Paceibacterota bacterium]
IGVGSDAKKFVLQSVGRGVRIEPLKGKRKRLLNLFNAQQIEPQLFEQIKNFVLPIESLFIFGTNAENLKEIITTLKTEKQDKNLGDAFILNSEAQNHLLLVPVYKTTDRIFAEEKEIQKYPVSREDFDLTAQFYRFIGDKVAVAKYNCDVKVLKKTKESFEKKERYYDFGDYDFGEKNSLFEPLFEPELILDRIFDYLGVKSKEFDKFKELENEIVHFKKIRFSGGEKYEEIKRKIEEIRQKPEREKELKKIFKKGNQKEYDRQRSLFEQAENFEINNQKIKIKYLANHYYLPVIVSETEKIDYLNHIINVNSEVQFIEQLEEYLTQPNNVFTQFDWWMFSKIDQTIDEVFIPYYNHKKNGMDNYHPDFIFWLQKGNDYLILFVDPHGTTYSDINKKIDYFSKIFEVRETKENKIFPSNQFGITEKFNIRVKLLLKPAQGGLVAVGENYQQY